ncbi:MAG: hypothetical protein GXO39_09110 [Thermotogae bacterium]|nr:hypothetical protein [Thermotogota bacterium]
MFHLLTLQYVMPPVEVSDSLPPLWYDSDTLKGGEGWKALYVLSGVLGYTYGSYADLSGVSIKGGHPKGTALLLNGVLVNQPQSGVADLSDVSTFLFSAAEIWEGGTTPYSIHGNLSLSYLSDTSCYLAVGDRGTLKGGIKWGDLGFDGGRASKGRDTLLYAEGVMVGKWGIFDWRISRKRTSGMDNFPQTAGVQKDTRVLVGGRWGSFIFLHRDWTDPSGSFSHDNLRLYKGFHLWGFVLGMTFEGIRSDNVGNRWRPLLSIGRKLSGKLYYMNFGLWSDGQRLGYSSVFGVGRRFFAELSIADRIPSFDELYWRGPMAAGNPNLKNERSVSASVGAVFSYYRLDAFARKVWNLIEWEPLRGIWRPINRSLARIWGFDLKFNRGPFVFRYLRMWAYGKNGKRLVYRPKNSYFFTTNPQLGSFFLNFSILYLDPRFTNRENTRYVEAVFLTEGAIGYTLGDWSLKLSCYNILNGRYQFIEGYTLPGRTFTLYISGRSLRFPPLLRSD